MEKNSKVISTAIWDLGFTKKTLEYILANLENDISTESVVAFESATQHLLTEELEKIDEILENLEAIQ